ncbi:PAS domain S-box protein [Mariniflexile sp.]|uniref:PAS domain S-box protein n=1 Tax=Mariniflexile sp. TaxID=1979402 RepID=UPI0035697E52
MEQPNALISKFEKINLFTNLFQNSPIPKSISSLTTKKYAFVNPAWEEFTGFSQEEVFGKTTLELNLMSQESVQHLREKLLTEQELVSYENFIRVKNGTEIHVLLTMYVISVDNEDFVLSSINNIDKLPDYQEQQELALIKNTEALFKAQNFIVNSIEDMTDGFVSLNKQWVYTYVNKKAANMLGRKPEELIGKHIWTEFPAIVGKPFYNNCYKSIETQQSFVLEEYYEPWDCWFENRIIPTSDGVSVFFHDVTERIRAQKQVKEGKIYAENLIKSLRQGITVINGKGEIIDVNPGLCKMLGYKRKELIGLKAPFPYWAPESFDKLEIALKLTLKGEVGVYQFVYVRKNGEKFPVEITTSVIKNKKGKTKIFFSTIDDITERKKNEELLIKSEKSLDSFLNNIGDPFFVKDEESRMVLVNDAFCKLFGATKDQIIGRTLAEDVAPEEQDAFMFIDRQVLATGVENINEETLTIKGGKTLYISTKKTRFIDDDGDKYLICIIRDVTQKRLAEQKLLKSEKSLTEAQRIAKVGSYNLDLTTKVAETSTSFKEIVGIEINTEFTFDIWKTITHPDDLLASEKALKWCIETGGKYDLEFRIITKDHNELKWIHGLGEVVFKEGIPVNFYGTIQDITSRKLSENEIAKANEELKKANNELNILRSQLEEENVYLRNEIDLAFNYEEMVYGSVQFSKVLTEVEKVAPTTATVLLLGESGTGKELLARAVHNISLRNNKPLIKVNCSAIPRELIESELFGHKKGSFTGAFSDKIGKFELADGGTLFLDEIGELPLDMQPKILRFLQEGEIEVVGGSISKKLDVRVIAATNRNLKKEIENNRFREDLYFRLNVFPIVVPPLKDRKDDIPLLVEHFVDKFNKAYAKHIKFISDDAMHQLKEYNWPGNIRELENLIERAVILSVNETLVIPGFESESQKTKITSHTKNLSLDTAQRNHIIQVLKQCDWKISGPKGAAVLLELKPSTLRDKMTKLNIVKPS